jgi:hypothetical protein
MSSIISIGLKFSLLGRAETDNGISWPLDHPRLKKKKKGELRHLTS